MFFSFVARRRVSGTKDVTLCSASTMRHNTATLPSFAWYMEGLEAREPFWDVAYTRICPPNHELSCKKWWFAKTFVKSPNRRVGTPSSRVAQDLRLSYRSQHRLAIADRADQVICARADLNVDVQVMYASGWRRRKQYGEQLSII